MPQEMESFNNHLFDEFVLEELERRLEMAQFPLLPGGEPPPAQADHTGWPPGTGAPYPPSPHCGFHGGVDDVVTPGHCAAHGGHPCVAHGGHTCGPHDPGCYVHWAPGFFCAPHGGHTCFGHGGHTCAAHDAHCAPHGGFSCVEHGMSCFQHVEPPAVQHPHSPHPR